ncbi:MAG: hypothetical protein M3463_04030 [Verrucomicrobiota bacterium]|nr:hypothetical protein [Verrucomicrobiota bacterium]
MSDALNPHPSLTQPQREAIFDLLLLAMYSDDMLKLKENERLYELISGIEWESYQEPREYSELATARVRAVYESAVGLEPFLAQIADTLGDTSRKEFALVLLERLLETDGLIVDPEHRLHEKAKAAFGL